MIFKTGGNAYTLAHEHKNGWNAEAFKERYSEVLERYDYIVGDWGYNQLRLRGFYKDGHPRATKDSTISCLVDYLNEYCNFGCAYFVLQKLDAKSVPPGIPDLTALSVSESEGKPQEETGEQTSEIAVSAVSFNGILMRWPLKERHGGPARMPGAAAVARAVAEAERRQLHAQATNTSGKSTEFRSTSPSSSTSDSGNGQKQSNRFASNGSNGDKRPYRGAHAGQAEERSGGKSGQGGGGRGPRPQSGERQPAGTADNGNSKSDAAKSGGSSRWGGKNRRRNRYGSKPNRVEAMNRDNGAPSGAGPAAD